MKTVARPAKPFCRPFQGELWLLRFPGLKPWAILLGHFMANAFRSLNRFIASMFRVTQDLLASGFWLPTPSDQRRPDSFLPRGLLRLVVTRIDMSGHPDPRIVG